MTRHRHLVLWAALLPAAGLSAGCLGPKLVEAHGIPVRRLPDEVFGRPKAELQPVPLTLLRQTEPAAYRLDRGDVLGVYVEDVLGNRGVPVPVQVNSNPAAPRRVSQGHPVPVQDDGTIQLPNLPPVSVKGKTLAEAQQIVVGMVVGDIFLPGSKRLVPRGTERVMVDLIQPRTYRVLVVREDRGSRPGPGVVAAPSEHTKKGAGYTLYLEAYKNDLLEALNRTGGPPGEDARNEVVIRRGHYDPAFPERGVVRVPMRARPDSPLTFTEADIILNDGDTVFIESRDDEAFYTAGLLAAGRVPLPRDHDVRVIEAIGMARGRPTADKCDDAECVAPGVNVGTKCPTGGILTVVRRFGSQREVRIKVDLEEALRDPRENILVLPGDVLVLHPCR